MADRKTRLKQIEELERLRGSTLIAYLTSTRSGFQIEMGLESIPLLYRHLSALGKPDKSRKIDLLIHSDGGDGIVPWRLVTLLREYASELTLLVPHRAYSAATLLALGCDAVYVHPMGTLGPTDPTVANAFNPPDPRSGRLMGINVEDLSAYIALIKEEVGIRHEDELVQAFNILAQQVHPLALGNVKRLTSQSRLMGAKLLKQRQEKRRIPEHEATEIVHKLTSQLYYHGHPISRTEAREDLGLNFVEDAPPEVADAMWALYQSYAEEMRLETEFAPIQEALGGSPLKVPDPPEFVAGQPGPAKVTSVSKRLPPMKGIYIESKARCDVRLTELEVTVTRQWTGELNAQVTLIQERWDTE